MTEPGGINTDPSLKYEGLRGEKKKRFMCTKRETTRAKLLLTADVATMDKTRMQTYKKGH